MEEGSVRESANTAAFRDPVIGIDLGTTFSCVGVWEHDAVTIIANKHGLRTTPSWVSYHNGERLVGQSARQAAAKNPKNTVFDSKRLIGCRFSDPIVQEDIQRFPFTVVPDELDNPRFEVEISGEKKLVSPEEVAAAILTHMRSVAEDYLGITVKRAVVTVPSYFSDAQRKSTKDAGQVAGLDIIRLINEPTAAAIAYGLNNSGSMAGGSGEDDNDGSRNIIVFDLGGGTLDVTLLTMEGGVFEVLATCGDTHLGGEDFDNNLVQYCTEKFLEANGVDVSGNSRAKKRLKEKCQEAKHALSVAMQHDLFIESLAEDLDLDLLITREEFETMNKELFDRCMAPVQSALDFAVMEPSEVGDILLIGGSSRMPYLSVMLEGHFEGKKCSRRINPDEAVAYGASIVAATATQSECQDPDGEAVPSRLTGLTLMDVTPLNLGIELADGRMSTLIPANTTIPYEHSKIYHNDEDDQTEVDVVLYEGMEKRVEDNKRLGCFTVEGLPPRARGKLDIEVTIAVDVNGVTTVAAKALGTDASGNLTIKSDKGLLSDSAVEDKAKHEQLYRRLDTLKGGLHQVEELLNTCKQKALENDDVTRVREWHIVTKSTLNLKVEGEGGPVQDEAEYDGLMETINRHIETLKGAMA